MRRESLPGVVALKALAMRGSFGGWRRDPSIFQPVKGITQLLSCRLGIGRGADEARTNDASQGAVRIDDNRRPLTEAPLLGRPQSRRLNPMFRIRIHAKPLYFQENGLS